MFVVVVVVVFVYIVSSKNENKKDSCKARDEDKLIHNYEERYHNCNRCRTVFLSDYQTRFDGFLIHEFVSMKHRVSIQWLLQKESRPARHAKLSA